MAELVDALDSKSCGLNSRVGSSPTPGTFKKVADRFSGLPLLVYVGL